MNQQRATTPALDDKQHLGVFKADLNLYGEIDTYDVRAILHSSASLVQLDVRKPIVGYSVLGFVEHKRLVPDLVVLPDYKHVRGNTDAERVLLIETVALLPVAAVPKPRTAIAIEGGRACYIGA